MPIAAAHRLAPIVTVTIAAALAPALPAVAQGDDGVRTDTVTALLRDMRRVRGTLVSVDERTVTLRDDDGRLASLAASDVVAVVHAFPEPPPRLPALEYADGQRVPGRPVFADGILRWRHETLGVLSVDSDRLARISLDPDARRVPAVRDDIVQMLNGDRLEGIVTALGSSITVERDGAAPQRVPVERVAAIGFVHAPSGAAAPWTATVWLADGSVLHARRPSLADDGIVRLRPQLIGDNDSASDRPTLLPLAAVHGVLFTPGVVTPLAALAPESIEVPPPRLSREGPEALSPQAPLGLSPIRLRGPIEVTWRLKRRGLRFVAEAEMPAEARRWGDLELVVLDGDEERLRRRVNAAAPRLSIDVALRSDRLSIRLEEGERGPIQDVIVLREAMLGD